MTREREYRAFRKYPKPEMIYFTLNDLIFNKINKQFLLDFEWVRGNIMEWTGLKDKNGVKIFEGDVIQPKEMNDSNIDFWDMEYFKDGSSKAHPKKVEIKWLDYMCGFDTPSEISNWVVVGNIYENPEQMKGDKG